MLEPDRQFSEKLPFVPSFAAIKVALNERGQPSIHSVKKTTRAAETCSIEKESRTVIHQSAQLRAGAWLLDGIAITLRVLPLLGRCSEQK